MYIIGVLRLKLTRTRCLHQTNTCMPYV
uniref:Uncharacterized protein n=1 Tax=Solanum lycopersicum TaxID=4081 RepID=A0A3Q7JDH6_SOLLC